MADGTLIWPADTRFVSRPDNPLYRWKLPLWAVRPKRFIWAWTKELVRSTLAPFFGSDEWLPFWAPVLLGGLILVWRGSIAVPQELASWWAAKQTLLWALPFYVFVAALVALYKVWRREKAAGRWVAGRYLYNEPKLAFAEEWTPEYNGEAKAFAFKDAEPGSLLRYKIEIDGPSNRIWGIIFGKYRPSPMGDFVAHGPLAKTGSAILGLDGMLELYCYSIPSTVPAIVRVYILSWEIGALEFMEFTRGNTRCVMAGPKPER